MTIIAQTLDGLDDNKNSLWEIVQYSHSELWIKIDELKFLGKKKISEVLELKDNWWVSHLTHNLWVKNKEQIESAKNCFEVEEYMRNIKTILEKRFPSISVSNIEHHKGNNKWFAAISCIDNNYVNAWERIKSEDSFIASKVVFDELKFSEKIDNLSQWDSICSYSFYIPGLKNESIHIEFSSKSRKPIDLHLTAEIVELRNYIEDKNIWNAIRDNSIILKERYTDGMTGLYNDEYVKEKLNQKNHNYSVIFIDIARFKWINDNYGQNFWDECIKAVAQFLEEHAKIDDKVCRNGWDEFMILIDNRNHTDLNIIEENLNNIIKNTYQAHMDKLWLVNDTSFNNKMPQDIVPIEIVLAPAASVKEKSLTAKELIWNANALLNELKWPEWAADRAIWSFKSLKRKARKLAMQLYMQDEDFQRDFFVSLPENKKLFSDIIIQFRYLINENISDFIKQWYELEEIQWLQDYINMIETIKNFMEKINASQKK